MSGIAKEYSSSASPLHQYLFEHMTPLNPHMVKLRAASLEDPMGKMLGASDELNFLQLLLGTLGARKTLDIGVFTGYRQVFYPGSTVMCLGIRYGQWRSQKSAKGEEGMGQRGAS